MTRFRLELLQWYALFAGPWMWATQHVLEFGMTNAHCSVAVASWNVPAIWLNVLITAVCGAGREQQCLLDGDGEVDSLDVKKMEKLFLSLA